MIISRNFRCYRILTRLNYTYHNFYDTLGVEHGASKQEIKSRYYELAKKYHPDSQQYTQDPQKFIRIKQAYQTLGDQVKRKQYDNTFYSSQHHNCDYNTYHSNSENAYYNYAEQQRAREEQYNQPFTTLLRKNYLTVFFYMAYAYMAFHIIDFCMFQVSKYEMENRQKLIDDTPGLVKRRKQYYEKLMKEKNIYGLPVDVKGKSLVKESTRSLKKKKQGIVSIEGIRKQGEVVNEESSVKTEYM